MLQIRTGCRLHFGLMELAMGAPLRFAGLGLMLTQPSFEISLGADLSKCIVPTLINDEIARRIENVLERYEREPRTAQGRADLQIEVTETLPLHSGLGAGTQLACAIAVGLELYDRFLSTPQATLSTDWQSVSELQPSITTRWLAKCSGRGLRSAVGLQGFLRGGLVLDHGYGTSGGGDSRELREITTTCVKMCEEWRVVLLWPNQGERISGQKEAELIAKLSDQPNPARPNMLALAERIQATAVSANEFDAFTSHLDEYMVYAAQLFQRQQGGMYNGPEIAEAVRTAQAAGLRGVGQSSWGPTVFGFAKNEAVAVDCWQRISAAHPDWSVTVSSPAQHGAQWRNN